MLWWTLTLDVNILMCLSHSDRSIHTPFPQISLLTNFSIIFLPTIFLSDYPDKLLATAHELVYMHTADRFTFQTRWLTRCIVWRSTHLGGFPFTVLHRCLKKGYNTAAISFWVVPGPSFLFLSQPIIGGVPWGYRWDWIREGNMAEVGIVSIWTTSLGNLLVPSGPAWA